MLNFHMPSMVALRAQCFIKDAAPKAPPKMTNGN
jgi:hypothetical protein